MEKTDRAAYKVLREHFASLSASGFDPSTAASELFAKRIINTALRDVTTRDISKNDKRKELVDGVMRCGRPGTFQTFLQILYRDDSYLAEQMRGERLVASCTCAFIRIACCRPSSHSNTCRCLSKGDRYVIGWVWSDDTCMSRLFWG